MSATSHSPSLEPGSIALISFPKSGNTFVRSFLRHLLFGGAPNAIPDIYRGNPFNGCVANLRDAPTRIYKTHDRIPPESWKDRSLDHSGYIHVIRHPLDVFLSYVNFLTTTPDDYPVGSDLPPSKWPFEVECTSVEALVANGDIEPLFDLFVGLGTLEANFADRTGSWFTHAQAWMRRAEKDPPVIHLRYEELVENPEAEFERLASWLGVAQVDVSGALAEARAETAPDGKFFWRQKPFGYLALLPTPLIERFERTFGTGLRELGY